jgi:hypothetical protein
MPGTCASHWRARTMMRQMTSSGVSRSIVYSCGNEAFVEHET